MLMLKHDVNSVCLPTLEEEYILVIMCYLVIIQQWNIPSLIYSVFMWAEL